MMLSGSSNDPGRTRTFNQLIKSLLVRHTFCPLNPFSRENLPFDMILDKRLVCLQCCGSQRMRSYLLDVSVEEIT